MLRILTGPFHPDLEAALVEDIRRLKAADSFAPLTIVVPSESLRGRLKRLLCIESGLALLDVQVLTFYQFALRLLMEADSFDPSTVHRELFFREVVHHLLRLHCPAPHWSALTEMPGAWGALLATLRDLKDARVEVERAIEALHLSQVGLEPAVKAVLLFHHRFLAEKGRLHALDEDDLAVFAIEHVEASAFLSRQQRLFYFGFYDLTQVQLDLFQSVSRAYPTTLYFPLVKGHQAYRFAEKFFERYIYGLVAHASDVVTAVPCGESAHPLSNLFASDSASVATPTSIGSGPTVRILSVSGPIDEATIVAKDILGLVEERGYGFQEIGVVARTLSGYESVIPRVFDQHGIPFTSTMGRSLAEFPLVKTALELLDIRATGFQREPVIGVLSSPYFRWPASLGPEGEPRPDLWDMAARRLGITKGLEEWRRLANFLHKDLPLRESEEEDLTGPRVPAQQIRMLWHEVSRIADRLAAVQETSTWNDYAAQVLALYDGFLDPQAAPSPDAVSTFPDETFETFRDGLQELGRLGEIQPEVSLDDFLAALHRLVEERVLPIGAGEGIGVQVLDAMAARGMSFRALYVLGLNEKVFPRHIHEDAFLRDRVRRLLEVDLGFKIQEKLAGYDEERLLFYLLCNSARGQVTLLYQRGDAAGRPLVPSGYLDEVKRLLGVAEQPVPRRVSRKFEELPQYQAERLTVPELTMKLLLDRRVPRRLLQVLHPAGGVIERSLHTLRLQESGENRLGPHDGVTGLLENFWQGVKAHGISPSALQEYAICPFRYFSGYVLRLESPAMPDALDVVGPLEIGQLIHRILRGCLEMLREQGYFARPSRQSVDPLAILDGVSRSVFDEYAQSHPIGYPLLWELHQERILTCLRQVLQADLAELSTGWEPVLFEQTVTGRLSVSLPEGIEDVPLNGRLDRVDWSPALHAYRIIDYKYKASNVPSSLEKNLKLAAVRAARLQPPLYLVMAQATLPAELPAGASDAPPVCEGVWFYYVAPNWDEVLTRVAFPGDAWTSNLKQAMDRALQQILSGIRAGRFFISPGTLCEYCDYRLLCRKTHQPTSWRARMDHGLVRPYRELRRARLAEAPAEETAVRRNNRTAGAPRKP